MINIEPTPAGLLKPKHNDLPAGFREAVRSLQPGQSFFVELLGGENLKSIRSYAGNLAKPLHSATAPFRVTTIQCANNGRKGYRVCRIE